MDDLAADARGLHLAVLRATQLKGVPRLLLVVDQFEELFTACKNEVERKAFIDNLLYAAGLDGSQGPTVLVVTLRADFYAQCSQYDNLRGALEKWQKYIGAMSSAELRRAIEEPAKRGHWEFEPGLVDLLLRDVGDEPGALPLLSHALLETWKRRQGRRLTLGGYHTAGGVHGAIAKTADDVYQHLKQEQQTIARNIFLRLTELGEGTQDTRRRAALGELMPRPEDQPIIASVLQTLADARLVTIEQDAAEVAHEALIREWPTLRGWLDVDREQLRIHQRLRAAAQEWQQSNQDEGVLHRGVWLEQATEWEKSHNGEMTDLEREFLETSQTNAKRDAIMREAADKYELDQREKELRRREEEARQRVEEARRREEEARKLAEIEMRKASRLRTRNQIYRVVSVAAVVVCVVMGFAGVLLELQKPSPINDVIIITSEQVLEDTGSHIMLTNTLANGDNRVIVPPGRDLSITIPRGNIAVYGKVGSITATITESGNINLLGASGDINLLTAQGSITADLAPGNNNVTARAQGGNVHIVAVSAAVNAATTNGNVRFIGTLRNDRSHTIVITGTGNIDVALPAYLPGQTSAQPYRIYATTSAHPIIIDYPPTVTVAGKSSMLAICGFVYSNGPYDYQPVYTPKSHFGRIEISPDLTATFFFIGTLGADYYRFDTNQPKGFLYTTVLLRIETYMAEQSYQIIAGNASSNPGCKGALNPLDNRAIVLNLKTDRGRIFIHHISATTD